MSSKLVKKMLQQTTMPRNEPSSQNLPQKRASQSATTLARTKASKEELLQEHVQSMLRLDNLMQRYSSSTAKSSFDRHASSLKTRQKQKQSSKKNAGSISNSRSSSSSFALKPHEKTFDKKNEKRRREEEYFEGLAKALKKARKRKKKP